MRFFSFDGVDGVGKTTQMELFCRWLRELGWTVTTCRDPGTTALGESLRRLLLETNGPPIARRSEMLIYMAARAQLVDEVIRPALERQHVVVSDRFLLANVAYQAHAGGLSIEAVWQVGKIAVDGTEPDRVFLLDMDVSAAGMRRGREPDRIEAQGLAYLEQVRRGFLAEAARDPERVIAIDAGRAVADVQQAIRAAASAVLPACPASVEARR